MRILVCGSRNFTDYDYFWNTLNKIIFSKPIEDKWIMISGMARGTDTMAVRYAEEYGMEVLKFPAKWDEHGKAAGPIRNKQMLDEGKPDMVIAFRYPDSRGTQNMIDQATKAGVPVRIVDL